jgi:hypothetical protein
MGKFEERFVRDEVVSAASDRVREICGLDGQLEGLQLIRVAKIASHLARGRLVVMARSSTPGDFHTLISSTKSINAAIPSLIARYGN